MAPKQEICIEMRCAIITLYKENISLREISRKLKISYNGVYSTVKRFKELGTIHDKKRSGRPKVTTNSDDINIRVISKRNRRLTAPEIRAEVNGSREIPLSVSTVKRRLVAAGLKGRIAARKPLLRPQNRKKRLEWARQHKDWSIEMWKKVLWTDESKFQVFGSNRRVFVRRSDQERMAPQCVVPTVKHGGGSVMVWGSFCYEGVGDLVKIDGILNKEGYKSILMDHALPSGRRLIGDNFWLQQDNDPKHSSKLCREYLKSKEQRKIVQNMIWPAQSPDLNPIELLWDELDRKVRESCPKSKPHLWTLLQTTWESLPCETLNKLIERMPRICEAVIKNKGNYFNEKTLK